MKTFDNIILIGFLAAGKSEFIDFLKKIPVAERAQKFHIGKFEELDDFPWLWEKFVEDNLWEEAGFKRLYSHREGNNMGLNPDAARLFDFLCVRFNKEVKEKYLSRPEFYNDGTLFIEFSRGREDGFRHAFSILSKEIFERAAILYINISYEESLRRNNARYEEKLKHSILAHKGTDKVMEYFYKTNDWPSLSGGKQNGHIEIHGLKVPFVSMHNEPELPPGPEIAKRYKTALDTLFDLYNGATR